MKRALLPVLIAAAITAGCTASTGGSGQRSTSPTPTPTPKPTTATLTLGGQKLTATLPAGMRFGKPVTNQLGDACTVVTTNIDDHGGNSIALVQLAPAGCERDGTQAINGFFGLFATPHDLTQQSGVQQRSVPAGTLATFNERYTQCTNSCQTFGLDVAVVFLTHPADPQRPAINIIDTTSLNGSDNAGHSVGDIAASLTSS